MTSLILDPAAADILCVTPDYPDLCALVAGKIAALIQEKPDAVLGLATGSTPLGVYEHLVHLHRNDGLDFSDVTCFNLDEYYPMLPESLHSYHSFMQHNLFRHINCRNWFMPDGRPRSEEQITEDCRNYEAHIDAVGGIDLQLLGIGRTGHIGFNEPQSAPESRTRLVTLAVETREDAAASFGGLGNVPTQAVSMGIGTILDARLIIMMASGIGKAEVARAAWTDPISADLPASWIRRHTNALLCLDKSAADLLRSV
ncbi:MAG: glucosamine-6-phosphate deaminase [Janthinobacterium lividum]